MGTAEYKKCRKCGIDKWVSEFRPVKARVSSDLLSSYCTACLKKDSRLNMKKMQRQKPKDMAAYMRDYRARRAAEGKPIEAFKKTTRARTLSDL